MEIALEGARQPASSFGQSGLLVSRQTRTTNPTHPPDTSTPTFRSPPASPTASPELSLGYLSIHPTRGTLRETNTHSRAVVDVEHRSCPKSMTSLRIHHTGVEKAKQRLTITTMRPRPEMDHFSKTRLAIVPAIRGSRSTFTGRHASSTKSSSPPQACNRDLELFLIRPFGARLAEAVEPGFHEHHDSSH